VYVYTNEYGASIRKSERSNAMVIIEIKDII
jgi:hypothetical protein